MTSYSPRYMTDRERQRIWGCLENRHRLVFEVMFYTGLRISEVLRIQLRHLSAVEKSLIIPRQKNKKIVNELIILPGPLVKRLFSYVACFEREIKDNNDYIFYSKRLPGKHISLHGISSLFYKARMAAGLQDCSVYRVAIDGRKYHRISPHTHKNASIMAVYNRTRDLRAAQCQGHHLNIQSTMRYLGNPLTDLGLKENIAREWEKE